MPAITVLATSDSDGTSPNIAKEEYRAIAYPVSDYLSAHTTTANEKSCNTGVLPTEDSLTVHTTTTDEKPCNTVVTTEDVKKTCDKEITQTVAPARETEPESHSESELALFEALVNVAEQDITLRRSPVVTDADADAESVNPAEVPGKAAVGA
jgi:hypothetical protein